MSKPKKQQIAAKTKKLKKVINNENKYQIKDEINFITQEKINILNHPAKKKVWGGAKDSGKTRPTALRAISKMEQDKDCSILAARKYKTQSAEKFHKIFNNLQLEINFSGHTIPNYEKGIQCTYRMINWGSKIKNQSIEYISFDDPNGIAGTEPGNLGYFGDVLIDEPVLIDDPGKTPTRKEWRASLKVIRDTIDRANRRYAMLHNTEQINPTYNIMLNLWDKDHPEVEDLNHYIPDKTFLEFIISMKFDELTPMIISKNWKSIWKSVKENHTYSVYNEASDTLYTKLSKFANPQINSDEFEQQVKLALMNKDNLELARILGMTYDGSTAIQKTWDLRKLKTADTIDMIKNKGYKVFGFSIGWDIDINSCLWMCPTAIVRKDIDNFSYEEYELVLPMVEVKAFGALGIGGTILTDTYEDALVNKTIDQLDAIIAMTGKRKLPLGQYVNVDDDQYKWLNEMVKRINGYSVAFSRAKKHKNNKGHSYDIISRTNITQQKIDKGFLIVDNKNQQFISDMKASTLDKNGDKRDEKSFRHKIYNTINSFEYSSFPWKNLHI